MSLTTDSGTMMTMPVQPVNGNSGFGFGGDGAWWIIILFLFVFCGWGGNWGNNANGTNGAVDGYVLTSDFANIERKLDGVNNGLCDGFYAMNTGMLNGFAGVNQAVSNGSAGVTQALNSGFQTAELSRANQQAALMQQLSQMQMQSQECCCENRAAVAQVRYDMATQACDTRNTVQNTTRDIIDAMNAGFRGLDQRITAQEIAQKDAKIAEQSQQLFAAQLAASQSVQNNYLVSQLRPTPIPAYSSCNPWAGSAYGSCTTCG